MHKSEAVLKNEAHKILRDFEIQTNHLILARRTDLVLINEKKRTCRLMDFAVPADKMKSGNWETEKNRTTKSEKYL